MTFEDSTLDYKSIDRLVIGDLDDQAHAKAATPAAELSSELRADIGDEEAVT